MVLHLLGKKSWNVYNSKNVERVRRDEADAQAREEAEEQRMQDEDAARRIAILRGEPVPPDSADNDPKELEEEPQRRANAPRKRTRLRGEDDTDRDIRYAREDAEAGEKASKALTKPKVNDAPLLDHNQHLQLIPAPDEKDIRKAKNDDAEAEKARKRKRDEDQYTMRFSNAAGISQGLTKPWYAASKSETSTRDAMVLADVQAKNVWGNEDPLRKDRERNRISSNDPFAAMQSAQRQLKQSESDRQKFNTERATEIEELKRDEARRHRHPRRHERHNEDSLEGFSLDIPSKHERERSDHDRHRKHRHHRRHRERSRSGERYRSSKDASRQYESR